MVSSNDVRDNYAQEGSAYPGGGIVIATVGASGDDPGSPAPVGNAILLNELSGNTPYDIFADGTGSSNTVSGNTCGTTDIGGC